MRKSLATAAAALLFTLATHAQDNGYWKAASKTASSITGDIILSPERLTVNFYNYTIAPIRTLQPGEIAVIFDEPADSAHTGNIYRLNIPADKKFLHKNTLCGAEDTTYMATYVTGKTLQLAFFSGAAIPKLTPEAIGNNALCGTYMYTR